MKHFAVSADIGSAAIENRGVRFFFQNHYGDGPFEVRIYERGEGSASALNRTAKERSDGSHYEGIFEVGDDADAHLLDYDCGGNRIHKFAPGRYQVYSKLGDIIIVWIDARTDLIANSPEAPQGREE